MEPKNTISWKQTYPISYFGVSRVIVEEVKEPIVYEDLDTQSLKMTLDLINRIKAKK